MEVYLKLKRTFDELQHLFDSEISCVQVEWEPAYTGWGIYSELTQSRMILGIVVNRNNLGNCTEFLDSMSLSRNTVSQNFQSASTIYFKQCF